MATSGKKEMRMNEAIRDLKKGEVRLLGENGEALGVVPLFEALAKSRAADLDLVEISPTADPPVCRIMDYGKFKYQQSKKDHDAGRKSTRTEMKELRIKSYKIGLNDLRIKQRQARQFLEVGHRLVVTLMFRSREHGHADLGERLLNEQFGKNLADIAKVESAPRKDGRRMSMSLAPLPNLKQILAQRAKEEEARRLKPADDASEPEPGLEPVGDIPPLESELESTLESAFESADESVDESVDESAPESAPESAGAASPPEGGV